MKQHVLRLFLLCTLSALCGCQTNTGKSGLSDSHPVRASWETKRFFIEFSGGIHTDAEGRPYSLYKISHVLPGGGVDELLMRSALSAQAVQTRPGLRPESVIEVIEDPAAAMLLIQERIPNETGPCVNYLLVRLNAQGYQTGDYLRIPASTPTGTGGIDTDFPDVKALRKGTLTLEHADGTRETIRVNQLPTADKPMYPG